MAPRLATFIGALVALGLALASPTVSAKKKRPAESYVVKKGDTLGSIAQRHACSVQDLRELNRLPTDAIRTGQELRMPAGSARARRRQNEGRARMMTHAVLPGETLGKIAQRYGTTSKAIRRDNRLRSDSIRVGQKLRVLALKPVRERRKFVYTIEGGDTLSSIGERFGMTGRDIHRLNPRKNPRRLRIGDTITVWKDGPEHLSETVGRASRGRLVHGEQLPAGPGYYRRTPRRSWGTNRTITEVLRVAGEVRQKHRRAHDLVIEHISAKEGGPLKPHVSHQSGRDVDMGMYFKGFDRAGPKRFITFTSETHELDYEASWTLLRSLLKNNDRQTRVQYIFMDYEAQKAMYKWARKKRKASKKLLSYMFQYPRRRAMKGKIRHVKSHRGHLHVRFKCPDHDKHCG